MSDDSVYQGSQAFNQSGNATENITRNTGSLNISMPIVSLRGINDHIGVDLILNYSSGSGGMLGLPKGWCFGLSFVVPGASLTAQGKTNIIDPTWSDSTGYESGLRYVNDHGVLFQMIIPPQPLPSGSPGAYSYLLQCHDGAMEYFDQTGKLLQHDDLFGNSIIYFYVDQFAGAASNLIDHIVDSFGQIVSFQYGPNAILITTPDGAQTTINYAPGGVQTVVDALENTTVFSYESFGQQTVISNVVYPTGLQTQLSYTAIAYLNGDGSQGAFVAVTDQLHLDLSGALLDHTQYAFGLASGANTFTGAAAGYVLSSTADSLIDSNNINYLYDVLVSRLGFQGELLACSRVYYNYLHLPAREEHYLVGAGSAVANGFRADYTYLIDPNLHARSVNYTQPVVTEQFVYSADQQDYLPLRRATAAYDDFGNMTLSEELMFDRPTQTYISQVTIAHGYAATSWGGEITVSELTTDSISGEQRFIAFTLTVDQKNHASSTVSYRASANAVWTPWKTKTFQYDSAGRVIATSLAWAEESPPAPGSVQSASWNTAYGYDAPTNTLSIASNDALGQTITRHYDVSKPRGPMTSVVSALGATAQYAYDALSRTIQETDALGNVTTMSYTTFGISGANTALATTPAGYVVLKTFNAQGRDSTIADNGDSTESRPAGATRLLRSFTYDALGRTATATNELGLTVSNSYDSFNRPVQTTDPLGNVGTTVFDDAAITTSLFMNGVLRQVKRLDGLGRSTSVADYPDPSDAGICGYRLHTMAYSGLGMPMQVASSFAPLSTGAAQLLCQSSYAYDVESRIVYESYAGTNGAAVTMSRTTGYDLLGGPLRCNKVVQYVDGREYAVQAETPVYDLAGRLITLTGRTGQSEHYSYDADGHLMTRVRYDGTSFTYTYDLNGQLLMMTDGTTSISYTYLSNGRVASTDNQASAMQFSYTLDGSAQAVIYPDGRSQSYDIDQYSRVVAETDAAGMVTSTTFDAFGRVATRQHGVDTLTLLYGEANHTKGVAVGDLLSGGTTLTRQFSYDGFGQLQLASARNGGGSWCLASGMRAMPAAALPRSRSSRY